jgi:hypothetical protein
MPSARVHSHAPSIRSKSDISGFSRFPANDSFGRTGLHLSLSAKSRARICKRLWSPGINSENSIPPAYVAWRAGTTCRIVVPTRQAGNRFLGSLKGLQIKALFLPPYI